MTALIRVRSSYQGKHYEPRYYQNLGPFLTLLQEGKFNVPKEGYGVEFCILFEYDDWTSNFDPELFQKVVSEQRDRAPRPTQRYSRPDAAMKIAIRAWRIEAATRINEVAFGLLS